MGEFFLIDVLIAAFMVGLWYVLFSRYNRRRGANALRWVEAACSHRAKIVDARWIGNTRVQAHLRFAAHWFENARVTIHLVPRPLPVQWALSRYRKQKETLTFEADLDYAPALHLEVFRHRWTTSGGAKLKDASRNWTISRPSPVLLTTSTNWQRELPPIVNALMTSGGHNLVSVRFGPNSPHLAATIDLDSLSGEEAAAGFLGVLRDLASGASASRQ